MTVARLITNVRSSVTPSALTSVNVYCADWRKDQFVFVSHRLVTVGADHAENLTNQVTGRELVFFLFYLVHHIFFFFENFNYVFFNVFLTSSSHALASALYFLRETQLLSQMLIHETLSDDYFLFQLVLGCRFFFFQQNTVFIK